MAKGKGREKNTWYCQNVQEDGGKCNLGVYHSDVNKKNKDTISSKKRYCKTCRKHTEHKRKPTKS